MPFRVLHIVRVRHPWQAIGNNQPYEQAVAGISEVLRGTDQLGENPHSGFRQASNTLPGLVGSAERRRRGGSGLRCTSFGVVGASLPPDQRKVEYSRQKTREASRLARASCGAPTKRRHWLGVGAAPLACGAVRRLTSTAPACARRRARSTGGGCSSTKVGGRAPCGPVDEPSSDQ